MVQYLAPGVYVEPQEPKARPIAGVGTSTAGFIGAVADNVMMPPIPGEFQVDENGDLVLDENGNPIPIPYTVAELNTPQKITNWEQFKTLFGDFQSGNKTLAHAVYGFFNNGGTSCWVSRLAALDNTTDLKLALQQFAGIDEIAIVAVPGARGQTQQDDIMSHCENSKDRFAILDGNPEPAQLTVDEIKGQLRDSNFAALYFPWLEVANPNGGDNISQPPSGHIAGVYARVDGERGVYKAPANEVLRGVAALERRLSREDQGQLNKAGINIIRNFNGNLKIWGARTLGGDANGEFKYISTQRFFNFLRESIDEGTQFVVFEPNSPPLWQRITRSVSDFLLNQWRDGALFGDKPQDAFFVRCNAETNPPEVRELGQVVTEIGVAIVKPAEFVIFRIEQLTGG